MISIIHYENIIYQNLIFIFRNIIFYLKRNSLFNQQKDNLYYHIFFKISKKDLINNITTKIVNILRMVVPKEEQKRL